MNVSLQKVFASPFMAWLIGAGVLFFYLFTFNGFRPVLREDRINFGIDLVGGTYITLEVHTDKAVETELADRLQVIARKLETENEQLPTNQKFEGMRATLSFVLMM